MSARRVTDAERLLIREAVKARARAYAPYSGFKVGAALLTDSGEVYLGANIENAAFTPSVCAERAAFFRAVLEGRRVFVSLAVAGWRDGGKPGFAYPCGVCRQVMAEFADKDLFRVITAVSEDEYDVRFLGELLPMAFGPGSL